MLWWNWFHTIYTKACKYGIKVWWVCDSITSYTLKGQIYTEMAASGERERNVGERVVKDLCINLFNGSGRNIVCDNFFTTYNLAKTLMVDNQLSILGRSTSGEDLCHLNFLLRKDVRQNHLSLGSAIILGTEVEGPKQKPKMILDYNQHKDGVDNMYKCLAEYSTKRRTNRWPLAFYYNILAVAAFAAFTRYMENNSHLKVSTARRRRFLHQLSEHWDKPEMEDRSQNKHITKHCYICAKRRPTRKACTMCQRPECVEHSNDITRCRKCT